MQHGRKLRITENKYITFSIKKMYNLDEEKNVHFLIVLFLQGKKVENVVLLFLTSVLSPFICL